MSNNKIEVTFQKWWIIYYLNYGHLNLNVKGTGKLSSGKHSQ